MYMIRNAYWAASDTDLWTLDICVTACEDLLHVLVHMVLNGHLACIIDALIKADLYFMRVFA